MQGIKTVEITPEQKRKWIETRSALLWKCPAFTHILFSMLNPTQGELAAIFTDDEQIPFAATDGTNLILNPKGFFSFTLGERIFVTAHEILHCILNHCVLGETWRKTGQVKYPDGKSLDYSPELMNIAMDLVINDILVNDKVGDMPKVGWNDTKLGTQNDSFLDVYRRLYENAKKGKPKGGAGGQGQGGGFDTVLRPGSGQGQDPGQAAQGRSEAEWKTAVAGAIASAKAQGKLPGNLERLLGGVMEPQVDWQEHIRSFFARKVGGGSFDWGKADRRFMERDIFHPRRSGFGCGEVVVAIDTSGSIGDPELAVFMGELNGILQDVKPSRIYVIWCDAMVHKVDEIDGDDDVRKLKPHGGGGTDFRPPFNWVEDNNVKPEAFVYLTDGFGSFPSEQPAYPVLWGDTSGTSYPWGDVVSVPLK